MYPPTIPAAFAFTEEETMTNYEQRVRALELEGMTTSDAQAVIDAEDMRSLYDLQVKAESLSSPSPTRYRTPADKVQS